MFSSSCQINRTSMLAQRTTTRDHGKTWPMSYGTPRNSFLFRNVEPTRNALVSIHKPAADKTPDAGAMRQRIRRCGFGGSAGRRVVQHANGGRCNRFIDLTANDASSATCDECDHALHGWRTVAG